MCLYMRELTDCQTIFFADSYWAKKDNTFVVATVSDPDGSETTDALRNQSHAVRCVKSRY